MATAAELRVEFQTYLEEHDVEFSIVDVEDNIVRISGNSDVCNISVIVDFDENGDEASSVHVACGRAAVPRGDCRLKSIVACNGWNACHRWGRFYVGRDGDVWADVDALIFPGNAGEETFKLVVFLLRGVRDFREGNADILRGAEMGCMELSYDGLAELLSRVECARDGE